MSELAFNMNGEPFEVPATATGWRVRRMKHKGAPEVVYGRDGLPLVLPLEAEVEDLRREVGNAAGRYRVDPVEGHRPIPTAPAGYVFVHDGEAPVALTTSRLPAPSDNIVVEAMRMNTEIARSVVDRFPQMLEAAAELLRAADGAGLPAREPRAVEDDEDGDDDGEPAERSGFDLNAFVGQLVPLLLTGLGKGKGKVPGLEEMLDWRKATPAAKAKHAKEPMPAELDEAEDTVPENANDVLPPIDAPTMAHFVAVQSMLTPEEAAIAREVARELSAPELRAWFDELSKLSVSEAVEKVRKLISGFGKDGGAS